MYKEALDRYLPSEFSRVVISRGYNDPPELKRYHLSDEEEAAVRKAFRKPDEPPHILIVTEKLLTGYDAPILYCMYLDKPMRDHVLLQAIARVNRPYEDDQRRKTSGLIVDYAEQHQACAIIRGLRAVSDFDYEFQLALMNRKLARQVDTVFLMTGLRWIYISSSIIKDAARHGGDIQGLVPDHVREALYRKYRETRP